MGDLKGLLDEEGIDINSDSNPVYDSNSKNNEFSSPTHLPTLDGTITTVDEKVTEAMDIDDYISDIEDEQFDTVDFVHSEKELEEKPAVTTEHEHYYQFEQQKTRNAQIEQLKSQLTIKLSKQIEKSVEELKINLIESMKNEIDMFLKK